MRVDGRPAGRRRAACASRCGDTGIGIAPRAARAAVRAVHAGRHVDHAAVRRHRAGPRDLAPAGRDHGRRADRRVRARPRERVPLAAPVRGRRRRALEPARARRCCRPRRACSSSTTTPPTARSCAPTCAAAWPSATRRRSGPEALAMLEAAAQRGPAVRRRGARLRDARDERRRRRARDPRRAALAPPAGDADLGRHVRRRGGRGAVPDQAGPPRRAARDAGGGAQRTPSGVAAGGRARRRPPCPRAGTCSSPRTTRSTSS